MAGNPDIGFGLSGGCVEDAYWRAVSRSVVSGIEERVVLSSWRLLWQQLVVDSAGRGGEQREEQRLGRRIAGRMSFYD